MTLLKPITAAKVEKFLSSTRNNVRKLYEVIPLAEAWTPSQIMGEMKRQGLNLFTLGQLIGTCSLLCRAGLIKELPGQTFKKFPTREQARAADVREAEIKQQQQEEKVEVIETEAPVVAVNFKEYIKEAQAHEIHALLLEFADAVGDRVDAIAAPAFTVEMIELEAEISAIREELEDSIAQAGELRRIVGELNDEKAEAKRIGKEWNDALTFEKAAHNITRDELHAAQGEIERLSLENAKFAQLKLLLREGM